MPRCGRPIVLVSGFPHICQIVKGDDNCATNSLIEQCPDGSTVFKQLSANLLHENQKQTWKKSYKLVHDPSLRFLPASTDIIAMIGKKDTRK